ncbi:MAG TPA: histidine phosphatase family protein, partial [Allocoleopsis sp.]
ALEVHPSQYQLIQQSNCAITVLNFSGKFGESVQLESMNLTNHVGEPIPKPRPKHEGGRLLLVRHGETQWNKETRFQGQIDVPLNENGKLQSQKAADFLKDIKIDCAFTSPMLRPKETAQIILQYHPDVNLEDVDGLKEISHGLWEGKLESEIEQEFSGQLDSWRLHPETVQMPEGENLQDVSDRAIIAWEKIVNQVSKEQKTALVVAHDATNKVILCHLLKLGLGGFWKIKQGNGAVTVIDYPHGLDGIPVLQAMNITTHLTGSILDQTAAGAL